jgi:enamine deaminase RidA (YjgF/YER057c/UK114 family)
MPGYPNRRFTRLTTPPQATLAEAGMQLGHLVQLTVFVTQPAFVPAWHVEAVRVLGETQLPTMQVVVVNQLATPGAALELSGYAAQ